MNRQSIILLALLSIFSFSQCKHRPLQADIDYAIGLTNEALSVVQKGEAYSDTMSLKRCEDIFSRSGNKYRKQLSQVYCILGRNYDVWHMETKEVPYFIKCIEMKDADRVMVSNALTHLKYICINQKDYESAEYFSKKCYELRKKYNLISEDRNKLLLAQAYLNNQKIDDANKLIKTIDVKDLRPIEVALLNETRYACFMIEEDYDSAEHYAREALRYPSTKITNSHSYKYLNMAECFYKNKNTDSCLVYINKAIKNNTLRNDSIRIVDLSLKLFKQTNDSIYYNLFASFQVSMPITSDIKSEEQDACYQLQKYIKKKKQQAIILFAVGAIACIVLIVCIISLTILRQKKKYNSAKEENSRLQNILTKYEKIDIERFKAVEDRTKKIISNYITQKLWTSNTWKDDDKLLLLINHDFNDLANILINKYKLNIRELRLFIMIVCNCSRKDISEYLYVSIKSIEKLKSRLSEKLNSNRQNLDSALIEILKKYS